MSDSRNGGLALRTQKRYGWRADSPDMRDYLLAVEPAKSLPRRVSLRTQMPAVYDQGQLGSCTANSIGAILEFNELKQAESDATTPSRLFIYYNERVIEGSVGQDSGAQIRDGVKSVAGYPFVFGFTVYESFESQQVAASGNVPMPSPTEHALGGHAVFCAGYDDKTQMFAVRNSWGTKWGKGGYCRMPYAYLTNDHLARDFWTIRMVES